MAEKNLEVKNLRISFRTNGGKVQAVRDISFDLQRGRTLAIVGESGSGKSVTSRAIMGILAGNAIIDGGEIYYDGKDLLKIGEEEMYKIRGDKIAMIFQDPLSSLNPIVKIGKQITEAMLLKNKASRKAARKDFNELLNLLQTNMIAACGSENEAKVKELIATFDKFCIEANRLENSYNHDRSTVEAMVDSIADVSFRLSKNQKLDVKATLKEYANNVKAMKDPYFTHNFTSKLSSVADALAKAASTWNKQSEGLTPEVESALNDASALLKEMLNQERPDFFRIGLYSLKNPSDKLYEKPVAEVNEMCLKFLDDNFMTEFIAMERKGVAHSRKVALEKKIALLSVLDEAEKYYRGEFTKSEALKYAKTLTAKVEDTIDRLEIVKDSSAYTFGAGMVSGIEKYFYYKKNNPKEEARFAKQTAKRAALEAKGKDVSWEVIPMATFALEDLQDELCRVITRLKAHYEAYIAGADSLDLDKRCIDIIDFLKDKASKVVYKVTPAMAKERAIKLMEEVGISEPRMRFYQYPFEFSGGMRQRIVIAIALSADPEILICDEPTTALDVTIQAQILELINNLKRERNLSVIFITHDLGVVANMADDIAVMYAGKIVEYGTSDDIFYDPRHPYTWALLSSMPDLDTKEKLDAIPGTPPDMIYPPVGDAFADRNKYALEIDFEQQPPMFEITETHKAATWLLHPDAPKVEMPRIITERIERMKKNGGAQNG